MADKYYPIPEPPAYRAREVRQLQDKDPASATQTFNPMMEAVLESVEYLNQNKMDQDEAVPVTRKVNNKALSGDITLNASDVGARPNSWTPTAADVGAVPTTRKVNGKALSADITLSANDVGARPNSWTPTPADVGAVPTTRKVNGKALSADISLSAADVGAIPVGGQAGSAKAPVLQELTDSNLNLNNYTTPGWYMCKANALAATYTNCPTEKSFLLEVLSHAGTMQRVTSYLIGDPRIWVRNYSTGVKKWGEWVQLYTSANKPTVNDVGVSNPNLLINWDFKNLINQRRVQNVHTGANIYFFDCWHRHMGTGDISVREDGVNISGASNTYFIVSQIIENSQSLIGEQLTVSILTADGKLYYKTGKVTKTAGSTIKIATDFGWLEATVNNSYNIFVGIGVNGGSSVTVAAVKLELGSVQTLARQNADSTWALNDPPPNKALELLKCQRYLYIWGDDVANTSDVLLGYANTTNSVVAYIPFPVEMRTVPAYGGCNVPNYSFAFTTSTGIHWDCLSGGLKITSQAASRIGAQVTFTLGNAIFTKGELVWIATNKDSTAGEAVKKYPGQVIFDAEM